MLIRLTGHRAGAALAWLVCLAATAQTEPLNRRIEALLGPSAPYEQAVEALQSAVAQRDAQRVAALVNYPISVKIAGKPVTLHHAADLVRQYDQVFTPDIAAAVTNQKYDELFVNAQGVMFGEGQVWIGGICVKADCREVVIKVIAIQGPPTR